MAKRKKKITGSLKAALGDCLSEKGLNSLLDTPFCPTSYRYIPLPLRHAIQHCNKRRPLSTLLKSYRVKTLLLGNRKTILLK